MQLTRKLKNQIKKAESLRFQFYPDLTCTVVCFILLRETHHYGFKGVVCAGYQDAIHHDNENWYSAKSDNSYRPERGWWVVGNSKFNRHLQSVFQTIPAGSEVRFWVELDRNTNTACVRHKLHGDALVIEATTKKGKKIKLEIDSTIGGHNADRFGYVDQGLANDLQDKE
jgi:hypothetical protein